MAKTGSWYSVAGSVWYFFTSSEKKRFTVHWLGGFLSAVLDLVGILLLVQLAAMITGSTTCFSVIGTSWCFQNWITPTALVLAFYVVKNAFSLLMYHRHIQHAYSVTNRLALSKFKEVLYQNELFFMKHGLANIYHRISSSALMFSEVITMPFYTLVVEFTVLAVIGIGLLAFYPILFAVLMVLLFPVSYVFLRYKRKLANQHNEKINKVLPDVHEMIDEATRGHSEIVLQQAEDKYVSNFETISAVLYQVRSRLFLINHGVSIRLFETIAVLGFFLIVVSTVFWVDPHSVLGIITLYVAAAFRILPSLNRIANATSQLSSHQYLLELVRPKKVEAFRSDTSSILPKPKTIELQNIAFAYPGETNPLFKHLNATLRPGTLIGLAGRSGSGKTTLGKILSGLIAPDQGVVLWNDVEVEHNTQLQNAVYLLPQEPFIFKDTVAANVTFRESVDSNLLTSCLERAHLLDWVNSLPKQEQTQISDKGSNISGGQKQRLSVARALYRGASVLVVDEPTNSLDEEARQTVMETLTELSKNVMVILISHREDELKHCELVIGLG